MLMGKYEKCVTVTIKYKIQGVGLGVWLVGWLGEWLGGFLDS